MAVRAQLEADMPAHMRAAVRAGGRSGRLAVEWRGLETMTDRPKTWGVYQLLEIDGEHLPVLDRPGLTRLGAHRLAERIQPSPSRGETYCEPVVALPESSPGVPDDSECETTGIRRRACECPSCWDWWLA